MGMTEPAPQSALALIMEALKYQQYALEKIDSEGSLLFPLEQSSKAIQSLAKLIDGAGEPKLEKGYCVPACFANVDGFTKALGHWIEHRRKIRKPPTGRAIQLFCNRLAERPADAIAAIDLTIERGWQSFEWEYFDRARPSAAKNGQYPEKTKLKVLEV